MNLLEQYNLNYDELNPAEKETFDQWNQSLAKSEMTTEKIKDFVRNLTEAVERELADVQESTSLWKWLSNRKKDIYLKARLKNYLMIYDFLTAPDKARLYVEQSLKNIKKQ